MSVITFWIYNATGHLNSAKKFALFLKSQGHHVNFLGIKDMVPWCDQNGFEYYVIQDYIYHFQYKVQLRKLRLQNSFFKYTKPFTNLHYIVKKIIHIREVNKQRTQELIYFKEKNRLDIAFQKLKTEIIILDFFQSYYFSLIPESIPIFFINTMLESHVDRRIPPLNSMAQPAQSRSAQWLNLGKWLIYISQQYVLNISGKLLGLEKIQFFRSLQKLGPRKVKFQRNSYWSLDVNDIPMIVCCPKSFEFNQEKTFRKNTIYFPSICHQITTIKLKKKIIYCSLGTLSHLFFQREQFFKIIISGLEKFNDYKIIISLGNVESKFLKSINKPNIECMAFVCQEEILSEAMIAITHGGLNTIKECIESFVPMFVCPFANDGYGNAARVAYHQIGISRSFSELTPELVQRDLSTILTDPKYQRKISEFVNNIRNEAEDIQQRFKIEDFFHE